SVTQGSPAVPGQERGWRHQPGAAGPCTVPVPDRSQSALPDLFDVAQNSAATLLIGVGDNPGRLTGEASFAALCGVSAIQNPPERSSTIATAAATIKPKLPCSSSRACEPPPASAPTSSTGQPAARPKEKCCVAKTRK